LSIHLPIRIITENTICAMPEVHIGFNPDIAFGFAARNVLKPGVGLYMALTGDSIHGMDCIETHIGTHFIPRNQIEHLIPEVIKRIGDGKMDWMRIGEVLSEVEGELCAQECIDLKRIRGWKYKNIVERCFVDVKSVNEVIERLECDEEKELSEKILEKMRSGSGISVCLAFENLMRNERLELDLEESLKQDGRIAANCVRSDKSDFIKGVDQKLVRKVMSSDVKWTYDCIEDVNHDEIDAYFVKPEDYVDLDFSHHVDALQHIPQYNQHAQASKL